jgi:hypothetical protein
MIPAFEIPIAFAVAPRRDAPPQRSLWQVGNINRSICRRRAN